MKLIGIQTVEEFKNTTFDTLKNFVLPGYEQNLKKLVEKVENILENYNVKFVGIPDYHTNNKNIQFVFMNENKEVINYI